MPTTDQTQTQSNLDEILTMLQQELVNCQDPYHAPHASKEERAAARWLYEQVINYKGLIKHRTLSRSIEFITKAAGPGFACSGTGWYYQPIRKPGDKHVPARNWIGPFPSHHEAELARISGLPRTKLRLELEKLLED